MAHMIDKSTGKAAVFTVGQHPWHKLGKTLTHALTGDQAIEEAGLNWAVEKRQAYSPNKEGVIVPIPDRFAIHRTDTDLALGVVGPDYKPLQNQELKAMGDLLVKSAGAHYISGGSLNEGRRVWLMLSLDLAEIRVKGEDAARPYLLMGNGHDGWHSIYFGLTSTFVVCMNTYTQALTKAKSEGLLSKLRHDRNVEAKMEEVRESLGLIAEPFKKLEEQANLLAEKQIRKAELDTFLESLGFDPDAEKGAAREKYNALVNAFETAPGQDLPSRKGTIWGAFNAVTYWTDHARQFRTDTAKENFLVMGEGDALKKKAMTTALAMAGVKG